MTLRDDVSQLRAYFLEKHGGVLNGPVKPNQTDTHDLGTASKRWNTIYAKSVIADSVSGGGGGGDAETVDGFHASQNPIADYLLALDPQGVYPTGVYNEALLKDGSRALENNLSVVAGATVDGVDISTHDHSGGAGGTQMAHSSLSGLDADDHPQYTQRAQDEIITGDWMFTHLQDRSAGWVFLPDDKVFKAVPHNMVLLATATEASIGIGVKSGTPSEHAILLYDDNTPDSYIKVGRGTNCVIFSGTDATARLWSGAATPGSAPFKVLVDGTIEATAGEIGGWTIAATKISNANLELNSAGRIIAGTGNDIVQIESQDATWRLWAGHATATSAPFRVNKLGQLYIGDGFVVGTLRSQNFISGTSGFSVDSSGLAEFENIIARGKLMATVFAEAVIQCASGRLVISDGAVLAVDMADTDDYFIVDAPAFEAGDIVRLKPAYNRDEWMSVSGSYIVVGDGFKYFVVRELNESEPTYEGPYDFYAGESVVRHGSTGRTSAGAPLASGEVGGEYGEYQPGGSPSAEQGGLLVLEGGREWGPYFGVQARFGSVYNQLADVVRVGNLKGILDYTADEWGSFFGDANDYMTYDQTNGLRINTRDGDTTINQTGVKTDLFGLGKVSAAPSYEQNFAKLYFIDASGLKLRSRLKVDATELERTFMFGEVYDSDADGVVESADSAVLADNLTGISSPSEGNYIRRGASAWAKVGISQILTDLKTVDGASSGLDADLLDGSEGAAYARMVDNEIVTGVWEFNEGFYLKDISVPGTPASGYGRLFVNSDRLLYKDDQGILSHLSVMKMFKGSPTTPMIQDFRTFSNSNESSGIAHFENSSSAYSASGRFSNSIPSGAYQRTDTYRHCLFMSSGTAASPNWIQWADSTGVGHIYAVMAIKSWYAGTPLWYGGVRFWGVQSPGASDNYYEIRFRLNLECIQACLATGTGVTYSSTDGTPGNYMELQHAGRFLLWDFFSSATSNGGVSLMEIHTHQLMEQIATWGFTGWPSSIKCIRFYNSTAVNWAEWVIDSITQDLNYA